MLANYGGSGRTRTYCQPIMSRLLLPLKLLTLKQFNKDSIRQVGYPKPVTDVSFLPILLLCTDRCTLIIFRLYNYFPYLIKPLLNWSEWQDSNLRPPTSKAGRLTWLTLHSDYSNFILLNFLYTSLNSNLYL